VLKTNRYIVDANFSMKVAELLHSHDIDVVHVSSLPKGTKTKDRDINLLSIRENRIVITRDHDFIDSYFSSSRPYKLLFISDFNQKEAQILSYLDMNIMEIDRLFQSFGLIELKEGEIIKHT